MANQPPDPTLEELFKQKTVELNQIAKALDSLSKLESELSQRISQGSTAVTLEQKSKDAEELNALLKTTQKLRERRIAVIGELGE